MKNMPVKHSLILLVQIRKISEDNIDEDNLSNTYH